MLREFAAPADCQLDLTGQFEVYDFDIEHVTAFARGLRDLALRPHNQLGDPLLATLLEDGQPYIIGADGSTRTTSSASEAGYNAVARELWYGKTPDVRGYLRFRTNLESPAKEVYVPDAKRHEAADHELTVDDIVEARTRKRIQVALTWDNQFSPDNQLDHGGMIDVHKRYYFLGDNEVGPTTEVLCVTVFGSSNIPQRLVYDSTFEEPEVIADISDRFPYYLTPVTMDDIERIGRRVRRNVEDYKSLADAVRTRKLGGRILRLASSFARHRRAAYDTRDLLSGLLNLRLVEQSEHQEDDPADGIDGDFSVFDTLDI